MTRKPWSEEELLVLRDASWEDFHQLFPERSYDAWEVKRRRIPGATAGRGRASARSAQRRLADRLAERVLLVLEDYIRERTV